MNNYEKNEEFDRNESNQEPSVASYDADAQPSASCGDIPENSEISSIAKETPQTENKPRNAVFGEISGQIPEYADNQTGEASECSDAEQNSDTLYTYEKYTDENSGHSDSYYMDKSPYGPKYEESFYRQNQSRKKKKRYISVPAAVASLVVTAVISITGGAALSNVGLFGGNEGNVKNSITLQENIENSMSGSGSALIPGATAVANQSGQPLSTPEIVDKVGPAVVGIVNKTTIGDAYGQFGRFYGDMNDEFEQSSGSGVIISDDGYIVTNNHVVENASKLTVILNTGEEYEAKTVGRDSSTDLALLKIEASNLTYAQMGTSSNLRVGETAIAIGNPLGQEFAGTTTQGIISGLNRSVTIDDKTLNLIQTDAAINPGNSGGALVNEYGVLIGINTAKISSDTLEGLGFAIPIDEAKPIIQELMSNGYVTGRPVVGIAGRAVTKEDAEAYNLKVGVYVSSMTANGPAYMAGMKVGDIIVECEGEPIETVDDINEIKNKKSPGDEIKFKVWRKNSFKELVVILGEEMPTAE